jgi:hypothetical protein
MSSNQTPLELDANLVNGQTVTFQFKCSNTFCISDLSATLNDDIVSNAPSFITSLQVTSPTGGGWFAATAAIYNVQFTYEGDGSDVVSDVAASIVAAAQAGSNDSITFIGGVAASASSIAVTPTQAVAITAQVATSAATQAVSDVGQVAKETTSQAGGVLNSALGGIIPLLIVVVLIIMFVLPSLATSGGKLKGAVA